ncbi:MAG: hypothetical protein A2283_24020 [Lentisphaerae bacterium RIFOXYA12_FULL_48_11]|nr:MAG: hypothetical protein A2283_24020 [Lentisphaerae bacterium RIFOXYA12_FULL_48_11]
MNCRYLLTIAYACLLLTGCAHTQHVTRDTLPQMKALVDAGKYTQTVQMYNKLDFRHGYRADYEELRLLASGAYIELAKKEPNTKKRNEFLRESSKLLSN